MSWYDKIFENVAVKIASYMQDDLGRSNGILASYYDGNHVPQLKDKNGQNDNIITNHIGVNVNRSVSRLLRGGVEFVLPEGSEKEHEYIDKVWELNKKQILLIQLGLYGAVFGTAYFKIVPDKINDPVTTEQDLFPRLVPLYPDIVRMRTAPDDVDTIIMYRIEWHNAEDTREIVYREDTVRQEDDTWVVENWIKEGGSAWQLVDSTVWPYDFAPIAHAKNLPSLNTCYGMDEESDAVNTQNKYNLSMSNTGKVIKHHAHPRTIFKGVGKSQIEKLDDSPDSALVIPNADAEVFNLEMQSDLASSRGFANDLQKNMATIMREIDMSSLEANVGNLTNFGIRVLYTDAIDKNDTKRLLYGDMLREVNRRLLVLAGMNQDAGEVQWGEAMIVSIDEEIAADKLALDMGIVDVQTVAERSIYQKRYGMEWEDIQERLQESKDERTEDRTEDRTEVRAEGDGRQGDTKSELPISLDPRV